MTTERYTVEIIQRTGVNGLAYVYNQEARYNEQVVTGPDAGTRAAEIAATLNSPPDPTVTGPCQVQATFLCTQQAAGQRLIPTSMLPDALISGPLYAPMCLPCYEHLSTIYLSTLHRGGRS